MAALAQLKTPVAQDAEKPEEVLIHVRFQPNADIFSIDACPAALSRRDWYVRLLDKASDYYQTLAGGRGFFRIPRNRYDAILSHGSN
jgi:hypothetical protein